MSTDLSFLMETLSYYGVDRHDVDDLITKYNELKKAEKVIGKMVTDKSNPNRLNILVSKYKEVLNNLAAMVEKPELYVKKHNEISAMRARLNEAIRLNPLGEEKLRQVLPLIFAETEHVGA
jgi:hypothetical protein